MVDLSLLPDFIIEAVEHLDEMESNLLKLESDPDNRDTLNDIFRSIHTIKGGAQFVGLGGVSELSHKVENLLDLLRQGEKELTQDIIETLIETRDRLARLTDDLERSQVEETPIDDLVERILRLTEGPGQEDKPAAGHEEDMLASIGELEDLEALEEEPGPVTEEGADLPADTTGDDIDGDMLASIGELEEWESSEEEAGPVTGEDVGLPAATAGDDIEEVFPEDENYDEEYDEELFDIFMDQLKENISFLQAQVDELNVSSDKIEVLNRCEETIKSLQSSANYMGYEKLTQFYKNWRTEIREVIGQLSFGNTVAFDFMNTRIDRTIGVFPQLEKLRAGREGAATVHEEDDLAPIGELEELEALAEESDLGPEEGVDASPEAAGDDTEEVFPKDENYDEAYDEELFTIFMDQLKENFSFLLTQIDESDRSPNKAEVLNRCEETIKSLQSSANYMGYEKLTQFYKNWRAEIREALERLSSGKTVSFDFLNTRIDRLVEGFPQLAELRVGRERSGDVHGEDALASIGELEALAEKDADTLHEEMPAEESEAAPKKRVAGEKESLPSKEEPETAAETPDQKSEEDRLFEKLSSAFDESMEQPAAEERKPLDGVIGEMLFSKDEAADQRPPAIQPREEITTAQDGVGKTLAREATPPSVPETESEKSVVDRVPGVEKKDLSVERVDQRKKDRRGGDRRKVERRLESRREGEKAIKHTIRVDADKIDYLMNQVGELVVSRAFFAQLSNEMRTLEQEMKESVGLNQKELKPVRELAFRIGEATVALGRVSNELQEGVMKVRMLPISQLFNRYPRLVRDLVHRTDKQVHLEVRGEDTELDKMVIEEISDPLIHMIRNAVDHGIESVDERKRAGKPASGTLLLEAYHESNHIVIEVTDDGRGLNLESIKSKALNNNLYSRDELDRMSEKELMRVVMTPGFSTAETTTETSGRGVGMDVVKKNIEKLNGTIEIDSIPGVRSVMKIKIPLTLAIIQALMVRVGTEIFTIPLTTVEETLRISDEETSTIEGVDVIHLRNSTMPIFRLSEIFGSGPDRNNGGQSFVVVVSTGMQRVGLVVNELIGQDEVVIKPLADYLRGKSGFSGATILGNGRISLILDIYELVNMTTERQARRQKQLALERRGRDAMERGTPSGYDRI